MIEEIDDQSFDMGPIVILNVNVVLTSEAYLIGHDHQMAITQTVGRCIALAMFQTENLFDMLDLGVFRNLIMTSFANVE